MEGREEKVLGVGRKEERKEERKKGRKEERKEGRKVSDALTSF